MLYQSTSKSKTQREVEIVAGFIKPSGTICAQIANDQGKRYFVIIGHDGEMSCHESDRTKCQALRHGRRCYHVDRVLEASATFMTADELDTTPVVEVMEQAQEAMVQFAIAYEILAETKQTREQRENAAAWTRYTDNYGM